jgi:hypothetical protein
MEKEVNFGLNFPWPRSLKHFSENANIKLYGFTKQEKTFIG